MSVSPRRDLPPTGIADARDTRPKFGAVFENRTDFEKKFHYFCNYHTYPNVAPSDGVVGFGVGGMVKDRVWGQ